MVSIIISGKDRTGKSVIGENLKNQNFCVIELGEIVRKEYFIKEFKGTVSQFYNKYRDAYLDDLIINEIKIKLKDIPKSKKGIVMIGVRSINLFKKIKRMVSNSIVIFIESDFNIRFVRYLSKINSRKKEPLLNKKLFLYQDRLQEKWGILKIKEKSDFILNNNSSINDLISEVNKIINI